MASPVLAGLDAVRDYRRDHGVEILELPNVPALILGRLDVPGAILTMP